MANFKNYRCTICHQTFAPEMPIETCPNCGEKGVLDIEYDYQAIKQHVNHAYFANNHDYSMWRYAPLMSIAPDHIAEMLRIGWTPLVNSRRMREELGLKALYIKDEGLNPSGSTKDRASGVAVLKAMEAGKDTISCSSTGNAASSCACQAAHMGLKAVIFVPKRAPIGKLTQLSIYGATVICVDGDYKDTFQLSRAAINQYHWYNRNAAINPHLVEGKKTVALEIAEQLNFKPTDWVAVSVGDGCTLAGVYKGFYDLYQLGLIAKIPRILGVQSAGCAPFYEAYINHAPLKEAEENTIADSIAVGIPRNPIKALNAINASHGAWITVTDEEILFMMAKLGRLEGIFGEPAGVAALAGIEKAVHTGMINTNETVTFIMTGNGLKDPVNAQKVISPPVLLKADIELLNDYLKEKGVTK
ncbi:MAG: threonine synthase [Bacilli bacterium]|jgi:threonine synthase|nr:threonine synthase [Bacilli bacterium]MDD3389385.1 threonine synthase [Bacilli bacterium]MDD4345082.1 threonine synthase [Bacilli bacterium]MDD4521113.1 threonine synthase [Bacilli bacterium]